MLKKIISLLLITNVYANNTLNLLTPINYTTKKTITTFQTLTNVPIKQSMYNDPNQVLSKLLIDDNGYDVIIATSFVVRILIQMHKLLKLDKSKIHNLTNIDKKFLHLSYDPQNKYSIPYAYTPIFLAYNQAKLKQLHIKADSWQIIFNKKYLEKLNQHIMVFNSPRNVFAAALIYLHKNPNTTNIKNLITAKKLIIQSAKYWLKFDSDSYIQSLVRGDVWVAMAYSTDLYKMIKDLKQSNTKTPIKGILQKEGNMYELDNIVLTKHTKPISYQLINIILDPLQALTLATNIAASTTNKVTEELLPHKVRAISWLYFPKNHKHFIFKAYSPKITLQLNEFWTEILMNCKCN